MKHCEKWLVLTLAVLLALPSFALAEGETEVPEADPAAITEEEEAEGSQEDLAAIPEGEEAEGAAEDLVEAPEEEPEEEIPGPAERFSFSLRFDAPGHGGLPEKLLFDSLSKPETFAPYERFSVYWNEDVPAHWLCIQWNVIPEGVELMELDVNGSLVAKTAVPETYDTILELDADTARVTFAADRRGMAIARLALFSKGTLPEPFVTWQPTTGHLDYLIVSTHPDDDVIFLGGVAPIYGMERGYTGTVVYVTTPDRMRANEALMGAWTMGVRCLPLFLGFRDISDDYSKVHANQFLPEVVTLALVRLLRQQRPLVVFAQDVNGEYGHWQHIIVSAAVVEACRLAADEDYDPASAEAYGVWEVKKCYLHLYPENPLVLDVESPLASMDGRTAIEVAQAAFIKHNTQQNGRHWVQTNRDAHPMSKFGMAYGTVEAGEDAFDNIDPALLVSALSE